MKANEMFHQQDMEMFSMVNEKTAARRKRREELELACIEQGEYPVVQRGQTLQTAAGIAVRGGMGLIVVGGAVRGLVDPLFGIMLAAMCLVWAWGYSRRSRYGNR